MISFASMPAAGCAPSGFFKSLERGMMPPAYFMFFAKYSPNFFHGSCKLILVVAFMEYLEHVSAKLVMCPLKLDATALHVSCPPLFPALPWSLLHPCTDAWLHPLPSTGVHALLIMVDPAGVCPMVGKLPQWLEVGWQPPGPESVVSGYVDLVKFLVIPSYYCSAVCLYHWWMTCASSPFVVDMHPVAYYHGRVVN